MDKVELYRQVFTSFKALCARGTQTCSFRAYCMAHGVDSCQMGRVLKGEYQNIKGLPGYKQYTSKGKPGIGSLCSRVYEDFKNLCAAGRQPGTFTGYFSGFGITRKQMEGYLWRNRLRVAGLPGFVGPTGIGLARYREVPFEDVIFEEAGFLPADSGNVITVRVDDHVSVSFPAGADVVVVAEFVRKMGKEARHVGA